MLGGNIYEKGQESIGGFDTNEFMSGGIPFKQIIEHLGIIQGLRNGDAQCFFGTGGFADICAVKEQGDQATENREDQSHQNAVLCPVCGGNTDNHRHEHADQFLCRAGQGAEAHQSKHTGDGNGGADLIAHHHQDGSHGEGQRKESESEAFAVAGIAHGIAKSGGNAQNEGDSRTD